MLLSRKTLCFSCSDGELVYGAETIKRASTIIRVDACGCGAKKHTYMTNELGDLLPSRDQRGLIGSVFYTYGRGVSKP